MVHIAESEWLIMKVLWEESPLSSREIIDRLADSTDWNAKTIHTLIGRLTKKGAIRAEKQEGSAFYRYYANADETECALFESKNFLKRLYAGSLKNMVSAFAENDSLTKEDIKELRNLLDQFESGDSDA